MSGRWDVSSVPDLAGKTYVVTGANSGIGLETVVALARRGARVIMACRNAQKAEAARADAARRAGAGEVRVMVLDLASLASVKSFAEAFASEHGRLDALINNAGLMAIPQTKTADGFEMQLGTNHLGHFALTGRLMGRLVESGPARVVSVASQAHRMGKIDFEDLMSERRYDRWVAYGQSKLANLLFTFELGRRAAKKGLPVSSMAAHPGYTATELQGKGADMGGSRLEGFVMTALGNKLLAQSPEMGALPTLRAALDPEAESGDYYGPRGLMEISGYPVKVGCTASARDEETARKLWERSVEITGVDYGGL